VLTVLWQDVPVLLLLSLVVDRQGVLASGPQVGFCFGGAETPDLYVLREEETILGWGVGAVVPAILVFGVMFSPPGIMV